MSNLKNVPDRYALTNELHARPFPVVNAPSIVGYVAFTNSGAKDVHFNALSDLLKRFGAVPVQPDATHHFCDLGPAILKWEKHTEFVTYTVIKPVSGRAAFDDAGYALFPNDWLKSVDAKILTSISVVIQEPDASRNVEKKAPAGLADFFTAESLAVSYVADQSAVVATDFCIDAKDNIRFAIFPIGQIGRNKLGRILQRLLEIETYKFMAMKGLPVAHELFVDLHGVENELSDAVSGLSDEAGSSQEALEKLLSISGNIEHLTSRHSYRFSATKAYGALVDQRIVVLREERFMGRQTFSEFMMRRFHPAMRTCEAASQRLDDISRRAARASDLLSTRVSVRQNSQNRQLLAQMDARAGLQLRLQETVESLSIVAISYYAVNLLSYLLAPITHTVFHLDKTYVTAALVLPVILLVAWASRRIRKKLVFASR